MKRILLLSFVFLTVFAFGALAQRTVSGKITDDTGETLPGVNVVIQGTTNGTTTDVDGNFRLSVEDGATLVFSFVGFETQEVEVGARSVIDITMGGLTELQEVVVVGYGTTTKETSSISSATISAESITNRPNASFLQTLSGQIPGVNIAGGSGQPGSNATINIRGVNSINGDTEPMFIIDGAPVDADNFRSLNPNEIASVSVLKDAGATAIYGNRGGNGVIIIKTKGGKYNSPLQVNYTFTSGSSQLQDNDYNLMSSAEQLNLERSHGSGIGAGNFGNQNNLDATPGWVDKTRDLVSPLTDAEIASASQTNWATYFLKKSVTKNHNLSLSKGNDNSTVFLSLGYLSQEGILQDSGLDRINIRSNVSGRSDNKKFNYGANLSLNYSQSNEPNNIGGGGINRNYILGAYQSVPYYSPNDYVDGETLLSPLIFSRTPLFLIDRLNTFTRQEDELKMIVSLNASYEIIEGLTVAVRASGDFQEQTLTSAEGPTSFNALLFAQTGNNTPGIQNQDFQREFAYNQVAQINYTKSFDEHTISVGAYTEYFKAHYQDFGFRQNGLNAGTFYPGDGSSFVVDNAANDFFVPTVNANLLEAGLFSYFGNFDYDYGRKYGIGGTIRRDASFRFAESNRWGTFYAVSGRWNVHNEAFASDLPFDVLKLRASYGTTGNQNILGANSAQLFTAPDLTRDLFSTGGGYGGANSLGLQQIGNNTLQWETVAQLNVGLDAEMLNGRLRVNFDVYSKTTSDLFQNSPVSAINSQNFLRANSGEMTNKGYDWLLAYDILRSQSGPNVTFTFVGNHNVNEITEFPGGVEQIVGTGRVGGSINDQFRYRYAGVNPANGNLLFLTADGEVTENPNVDTDRVWLGRDIYPDYVGSFSLNADYKGFFLTAQMNYTLGVDRLDFDLSGFQNPDNIGQFRNSRDLLRAWTPDNRLTDIPSLTATNRALGGASDRYLTNADYLRLRFVSVGYNVPSSILDETGFLRTAKVFFSGENLLTVTKWRGFDVESQNNTSRLYPAPKTFIVGVELGF